VVVGDGGDSDGVEEEEEADGRRCRVLYSS
jgi:hypothetical protein